MEQTLNQRKLIIELKSSLKARKVTQATIAEMLQVHPVCVSEVMTGRRKNPRIRKAIALYLGKDVDQIDWPDKSKEKAA